MKNPINSLRRIYSKLRLQTKSNDQPTILDQYPVEIDHEELRIMNYILKPSNPKDALSMVSCDRLWAVLQAVKYVVTNQIEGDMVECGVWRGGCSLAMAMMLRSLGSEKKIYLYDTFSGMTQPTDVDVEWKTGDNAWNAYKALQTNTHNEWCFAPIEDVKANFEVQGLLKYCEFIKGDVVDTLRDHHLLPEKISLLRLDTDWYESTAIEMNTLYPRLSKNGVLLVDDYGHWKGSRKAVDEFFQNTSRQRPLAWKTDYTGRGYIKTSD